MYHIVVCKSTKMITKTIKTDIPYKLYLVQYFFYSLALFIFVLKLVVL